MDKREFIKRMPAEWAPSDVISSNTYRHYPEHTESIQRLIGPDSRP